MRTDGHARAQIALREALASLVSAILALGIAPSIVAAGPAVDGWIEVRTGHFQTQGNASEAALLAIADRLETFRAILPRVSSNMSLEMSAPTSVFVFKNRSSLSRYAQSAGTRGFSFSDRDGSIIALSALPSAATRRGNPYVRFPYKDLFHEYTHIFLANNFNEAPLWVKEGLAEYYSTFSSGRRRAEIGRPIPLYLALLRRATWIPLPALAGMRSIPEDSRTRDIFYAQSWAMVHYMVSAGGERKEQLDRYLEWTDRGAPSREAFEAVFGATPDRLERDVREHVARRRFRYARVDATNLGARVEPEIRALPREEVLYRLGDLLSRTRPDATDEAEMQLREALAIRADFPGALVSLGYVLDLRGRHADAQASYRRAIAIDPSDPRTPFLCAQSLMREFQKAGSDGPTEAVPPLVWQARELYAKSAGLDPSFGDAHAGAGATYTFDPGDPSRGLAPLREARRLMPARMDVAYNLAALLVRSGDRVRARTVIADALRSRADAFLRAVATAAAVLRDPARKGSLARRAELPILLDLVAEALPISGLDPATRARIGAGLERIRTEGVPPSVPAPESRQEPAVPDAPASHESDAPGAPGPGSESAPEM